MKTFTSLRTDAPIHVADNDGTLYAERSIGLARENMPQIANADLNKFIDFVLSKGFTFTRKQILPGDLHPTQYELNPEKIVGLKDKPEQLAKSLIAGNDLRILDGHHRWAASAQYYPEKTVDVYVASCDILTLINLAKEFPQSFTKGIAESIMPFGEFIKD